MARQVSISLEKEHIKAVKDFMKKTGIKKFSTALQAMIHQFQQLQAASAIPATPPTLPANGNGPDKE